MGGHSHQHSHAPTSSSAGPTTSGQSTGLASQDGYGNAHLAGQLDHGHSHDHGVDPAPGAGGIDLDTERPVGGAVSQEVRDELYAELLVSDRAAWLLNEIQSVRGDLAFPMVWSDKGTFHRNGKISLRRTSDPATWFASLAHELVHLLTYESGEAADAKTMDCETFVLTKMADEINAQALSYVATMQTAKETGGAYYDEFYAFMAANHPHLMVSDANADVDQQNWAEVEEIAREWLTDQYKNHLVTNNTKENYYVYWENYWERINKQCQ